MKMQQIFETTVMSETTDHTMHVVVVPQRSLKSGDDVNVNEVVRTLDLKRVAQIEPVNLVFDLAVLLSPTISQVEAQEALVSAMIASAQLPKPSKDDIRFAEQVCFDRMIPIEQSPLSVESLGKLATMEKVSGAGIGAFVGIVAFGQSPLLLLTVPAGMIICGAASGLAQALEKGLKE